jgi:hypothetical protein
MAEEKASKQPVSLVPEVKREIIRILVENGMAPRMVEIIAKMQPYKIQLFERLYEGYAHRPDYVRMRAKELMQADMEKPHIRALIERPENRAIWDEEKFLDFAVAYYRKSLVLEFLKTEMHEYLNTLASSQDRTNFILASQPEKVRIV